MDKITLAGDVGGDVEKYLATQEPTNPAALSTKAHVMVESLADKAKPAVDKLADAAHESTDQIVAAASEAIDWLSAQNSNLSAIRVKLLAQAKTYVSENPIKAIAIGVVAGILLTRLLGDGESHR